VAGAVIGGLEPFDQPGIETIAAEEIDRHRAAPIAGTGGERSGSFSGTLRADSGTFVPICSNLAMQPPSSPMRETLI
jgi:hypothetical protein